MMRQYELVERVRSYNPHTDEDLLNRAYVYAMRAHGLQKRASGDPFFSHPLEVASILTGLKLDDATIVAAVLHDTIEDTDSTREEIDRLFGEEIGRLVEGLTKIKKLDVVSRQTAQAENFRKLLLAISQDVRVLLVKLADRLHNMRTLHFVSAEKASRIAEETLDIYGPLAGRMGMQLMREELEELAFRFLSPEAEQTIRVRLEDLQSKNGAIILRIEAELREELASRDIFARVTGRQKSPYSIWRKMERKSLAFEQLSDIYGFRVVVESADDCYRVLGAVHTKWPNVPGRFKDYISTPKQNDYRSLHTTVVGPGHQRVELQIRSEDMDGLASDGIAAHFLYKDHAVPGGLHTYNGAGEIDPRSLTQESGAYRWLQRTLALLAEGDSPEEFLEHTKLELFHDQVFCFTPKGRLIALPRGATVIDFAYAVHTDVGNRAVGAKINGHLSPLVSELSNGDEVEVIRAETSSPPAAWQTIAVTGKARAAIRRATRDASRQQYRGLGQQIVARAFERSQLQFDEDALRAALPRLARTSVDEVLTAVGRGEISSEDVLKAVHPKAHVEPRGSVDAGREGGWFNLRKASRLIFKDAKGEEKPSAIPIRGQKGDQAVRFAPHSGAVPGDRIVGIRTPGEGITIYPIQSPALAAFDNRPDLWLDVRWDVEDASTERFPAQIKITSINEPGTLGIVTTLIGETGANIDNLAFITNSPDFNDILIDLDVYDLKHLTTLLSRLRAEKVVSRVERIYG